MASSRSQHRDTWLRAAGLIVVALAGCSEPRPVRVDVPPDVEWVALVSPTGATPLVRWLAGAPLPAHTAGGETIQLVGYTAEQVRQLPVQDGARVAEERLRLAKGCERHLPVPAWFGELTPDDLLTTRAPSEAPVLTASWISCPTDPVLTHATCLSLPCAIGETQTIGCAVRVDLSACGAGVLVGERQADGSICFEPLPWTCEPVETLAPEITAQACANDCRTSVFEAPREPPFTLERVAVTGGELYLPGELTDDLLVPNNRLHSGKAFDLALLRDRLVVAHAGATAVYFCPIEAERPAGRLSFYDLDSLALVGTATAPECLTRLLGEGDTFVGVHGARGEPVLSRFSREGRRLASGPPSSGDRPRADAAAQIPADLVRVGRQLAVIYEWLDARPGGVDLGYFLYGYDPTSLEALHTDLIREGRAFAMAAVGTSSLAIAEEKYQRIDYFDVERRVFVGATALPTSPVAFRYDMTSLALAPGTRRLLATTPLDLASVRLVNGSRSVALVLPFERTLFPTSTHAWPGAPDVLVVAGVSPTAAGAYDAVITRFDTRAARFLPGTWTIGQGAVTRMVTDGSGRLWALLPWAGEVVRLTPR